METDVIHLDCFDEHLSAELISLRVGPVYELGVVERLVYITNQVNS